MTSTELRKFWHRSPFVPFDLVIPGRAKFHVPHADFLSVSPSGRIALFEPKVMIMRRWIFFSLRRWKKIPKNQSADR
jgi:hypothetical protein